ncbi:hypothetical protein RCL1_002079 [Eukaryota sp. TZLM3-RCL]
MRPDKHKQKRSRIHQKKEIAAGRLKPVQRQTVPDLEVVDRYSTLEAEVSQPKTWEELVSYSQVRQPSSSVIAVPNTYQSIIDAVDLPISVLINNLVGGLILDERETKPSSPSPKQEVVETTAPSLSPVLHHTESIDEELEDWLDNLI